MACFHPLTSWRTKRPNDNGKFPATFNFNLADTSRPLGTRCGRCIGCRLDWARGWGIRMVHEHRTTEEKNPGTSFFLTLTYDEANLPWSETSGTMTLRPDDMTRFLKRLRKKQASTREARGLEPVPLRYFQGGEYGERTQRPHHHAIVYNLDLSDLRPLSARTSDAHTLYASEELESLWGHGFVSVGRNVQLEATRYVAAYVTKKIWAKDPADLERHYHGRVREYHTMSRNPGLGTDFWNKYHQDLTSAKGCTLPGKPHVLPMPRFYIDKWRAIDDNAAQAYADELELTRPNKTGRQLIATEVKHQSLAAMHARDPE